jgi:hypothetical protein
VLEYNSQKGDFKMNKEEYARRKKILEDIEKIYGISMEFQKGVLEAEATLDAAKCIPTENSPIYTEFHA